MDSNFNQQTVVQGRTKKAANIRAKHPEIGRVGGSTIYNMNILFNRASRRLEFFQPCVSKTYTSLPTAGSTNVGNKAKRPCQHKNGANGQFTHTHTHTRARARTHTHIFFNSDGMAIISSMNNILRICSCTSVMDGNFCDPKTEQLQHTPHARPNLY